MRECLEAVYRAAASENLLLATVASNCQTRSVHFSWSVNFQPPRKILFNRNNKPDAIAETDDVCVQAISRQRGTALQNSGE